MSNLREALRNIRTFPQLVKFLRDTLDWPIESDDFEELTFDYTPEELGMSQAHSELQIGEATPVPSGDALCCESDALAFVLDGFS